jgi:hypothetical protein
MYSSKWKMKSFIRGTFNVEIGKVLVFVAE